jgi:hypothetical protein
MAATAHSDPYGIFMRKIGYSVGLERTLERLGDLQKLYLSSRDITLASWKELVKGKNGWRLKTDNIADVFSSLELIHRTPGDILVLDNLDATAIAVSLLDDEEKKYAARSFIFLWAVLVNDGEIFVNLLLAGFKEKLIKEKFSAMIRYKRQILAKAMPGKDAAKRIGRVVTIERQEKNKGSASVTGRSITSLKRTEPLQKNRSLDSDSSIKEAVEFSNDYFRKVPPRRKDWAKTLGLWSDDTGPTILGADFTDCLRSSGYIGEDGFFTFWPMDYELVRAGFKPNLLQETKTLWDTLIDFADAYGGLRVKSFEQSDTDNLVDHLKTMMKVYRSLHTRKSMLRRELAITTAYPASVAIASASKEPVIDLPKALNAERKGEQRRINFRRSRNTGGALSVKR